MGLCRLIIGYSSESPAPVSHCKLEEFVICRVLSQQSALLRGRMFFPPQVMCTPNPQSKPFTLPVYMEL